jgi:hypothetical protein
MTKSQHFADVLLRTAKTALVAYPILIASLAGMHFSNAFILKITGYVAAGTAVLNIGIKIYNAMSAQDEPTLVVPAEPTV